MSRSRLSIVLCAMVVAISFAIDARQLRAAPLPESSEENVRPYTGSWSYRYGESPRRADGSLEWSSTETDGAGWQPTRMLHSPPGRQGHAELWLRTRLVGPTLSDPTLFLHEVDQRMEAYLDGQLIERFGSMDDAGAERFTAKRPIHIALPETYVGHTLTLRFRSVHNNIGVIRVPRLGGRADLLIEAVQRGLPFLIVGVSALVLGIGVLIFALGQRRERLYLLYTAQCLVIGPYLLSRSLSRAFLFDNPALWRFILVLCFCLISAAMSAFTAHLFERGIARLVRWVVRANLALFLTCLLLVAVNVIHLETFLRAAMLFWLPFCGVLIMAAFFGVWRGNADLRILALGLISSAFMAIPLILAELDVVAARIDARALIGFLFLMTLGAILMRRFRSFHKRLADYSTVLKLSLSASDQTATAEHAQSTLAALLRILEADRAVLFLCGEDGTTYSLLAARNAQGPIAVTPDKPLGHDQSLVEAAAKKRRPVARTREVAHASDTASRESVMAAPLLVQGRLLGVLYLEAAASRRQFAREDLDILIALGSQVALTLTATRAGALELESTQTRKRLGEQQDLLEAVGRMATGELNVAITVDEKHELAPLARAMEDMRKDLLAKLRELEKSHAAVQQLNADLRYQLEHAQRR